jgi:hypothetical protein
VPDPLAALLLQLIAPLAVTRRAKAAMSMLALRSTRVRDTPAPQFAATGQWLLLCCCCCC